MVESIFNLDRRLYLLLHGRLRAPLVDPIMVGATRAGTKGILWLALAAGLFIDGRPHPRFAAIVSIAALLAAEGLINLLLKPLIRRERPFAQSGVTSLLVNAPGPHSWPSAHAGSSMAAAIVLTAAYPLWGFAFLPAALLVGYSRVYVGVHYPLDIVSGIVVGLLAGGAAVGVAYLLASAGLPTL